MTKGKAVHQCIYAHMLMVIVCAATGQAGCFQRLPCTVTYILVATLRARTPDGARPG